MPKVQAQQDTMRVTADSTSNTSNGRVSIPEKNMKRPRVSIPSNEMKKPKPKYSVPENEFRGGKKYKANTTAAEIFSVRRNKSNKKKNPFAEAASRRLAGK